MKDSFKSLSAVELKVKKEELSKKYMEHRFQRVIGHVENPLESRILRRKIARLNTLIAANARKAK
ncbi:MAG: 50S ribosomal protein L29 [Spirochaetaceae bacterium]|jgi:large subunit ribosomal protein L29|nr:50S ribosomal protein L29 [Spirochaetaceae bacterium]